MVVEASAFDPLVFSNLRHQSVAVRPGKRHLDVIIGQPVPTAWATRAFRFATAPAGDRDGPAPEPWPGRDWSKWHLEYDYRSVQVNTVGGGVLEVMRSMTATLGLGMPYTIA